MHSTNEQILAITRVTANVVTAAGEIQGNERDQYGVISFKGVPYASPPVASLRWVSPQPTTPWQGVRSAMTYGSRCISAWRHDPTPTPSSEDCLTLNVWTAAETIDDLRPVMVWIHGGGFEFGSSADPSTDGTELARKGVVVVSFNYRLGVFGFLAHPQLDAESPSGNYGLQDQIAALRWVQENIKNFGGDPDNVTLFGESAGAHAVGILMASPLSTGLFHKAVAQSGAFWDSMWGGLESFAEARARGISLADRLGARDIAQLRALPAHDVNAESLWDFQTHPQMTAFSPNIDGYVVLTQPAKVFRAGMQARIPMLAGWNAAEDYPFRPLSLPHESAAQFRAAVAEQLGIDHLEEFLTLYRSETDDEATLSAYALAGDLTISEQTWQLLDLHRNCAAAPVFGYRFGYTSEYVPIASHLVDVPFVFGTLTPQFLVHGKMPPLDTDIGVSRLMQSYWINFATNGDPNGPGLPVWPRLDDSHEVLLIDSAVPRGGRAPEEPRFEFLGRLRREGAIAS